MRNAMIVIAMATLLAASASAERFAPVKADTVKGEMVAFDLDTIRQVNGNTRAWVLSVKAETIIKKPVHALTLHEFDCKEQRSRILTRKMYDETSLFLGETATEDWTYPAPDSAEYVVLGYGCGKKVADEDIISTSVAELVKSFMTVYRQDSSRK